MKKKLIKNFGIIMSALMIPVLLCGCDSLGNMGNDTQFLLNQDETYEKSSQNNSTVVEDMASLYEDEHEVKVMYMTVGKGSAEEGTNHTWDEVVSTELSWFEENDTDPYKCEAVVQFGNETGPVMGEFGYGVLTSNATVKLSGQKASSHQQKNYKISIKNGSGSIDGMKDLILSKSFTDPFRFANKLCYELMEDIPQLLSTRTSFVHLYIKDVTESSDTKFVDYGLYTMIEPINKKYLKNRNLNNSGELYKIVDFDWKRHKDVIVQPTDMNYNKDEFEKLIESKGGNDYSGLIAMLDAVNDESIPIHDVINKFFDKDNLYSWMAFNILVDNKKVATENCYIYRPVGNDKFYFIAWDNDGALREDYEILRDSDYDAGWEQGIFLYSDAVLFNRMLQDEDCISDLSEAVDKLHEGALSSSNVLKKAMELSKLSKEYTYALPDMSFARVNSSNHDVLVEALSNQMERNYYKYYDSIKSPWPFHINEPVNDNGQIIAKWDESHILGMNVKYNVEIDDSWDFASPIFTEKGVTGNSLNVGKFESGQYFIRVTAVADNGYEQQAYEFYNTEKKSSVNGILCFYVMEDGTVAESTFK